MRRYIVFILIGIFFINLAQSAHAENPIDKFSRGLCNMVTFHFEIFEQSRRVKTAQGSIAGMTYGLGKGFCMAIVRALVGLYEVVTFPLPYPENYEPILKDPVSFFPEPKKTK